MSNQSLIVTTLTNFTVNNVVIPVEFLHYEGHGEPYITFMRESNDGSFAGDDDLLGYIEYYDFDVYAKGNYLSIVDQLKTTLKTAGFVFQPSRSSEDMYESDTGYYHITLNFAIPKEE